MLILFLFVLGVVFWTISLFFNDIEDSLQYHYTTSIFDWIPKDSWWSWYMLDPDDTWKRKYNWSSDGSFTRKKWHGIPIPAFMFDGWHLAKTIRQVFQYLFYCSGVLLGIVLPLSLLWILLLGAVIFAAVSWFCHDLFFDGILYKFWWSDRNAESTIKIFLDKHF